jgi:enoyl-CoA hydratase/carnithine racemase
VEHGVIPDSGGAARLVQIAGHGLALDLALTGRIIDAGEALRHGIVSRVVANDRLDDEALEIAHLIAARSPLAVKAARATIQGLTNPALVSSMNEEKHSQATIFASADYHELKSARSEGRPPTFTGH